MIQTKTRGDYVHQLWHDSARKFDYYLTGLSVALIAYWGKGLNPPATVFSRESLLAAALSLLLLSVILGLLRMEKDVQATGLNFQQIYLSEQAQVLESASTQGPLLHDIVHGTVQTPENVRGRAEKYRAASKNAEQLAVSVGRAAQRLYVWRGRTLALGLLLAIVSRMLPAN